MRKEIMTGYQVETVAGIADVSDMFIIGDEAYPL